MTDMEARAVVAHVVFEGLAQNFPEAEPVALRESAVKLVNAVLNNYQRCLMLAPKNEEKPS